MPYVAAMAKPVSHTQSTRGQPDKMDLRILQARAQRVWPIGQLS